MYRGRSSPAPPLPDPAREPKPRRRRSRDDAAPAPAPARSERVSPEVPAAPARPDPERRRRRGWSGDVAHEGFRGDGTVRSIEWLQGVRTTGSRAEARRQPGRDRRSRAERIDDVMWTLGVYRAVSRRAVVASCFDGHVFAANPVLAKLSADGLIRSEKVKAGKYGYQVLGLTAAGADWLRGRFAGSDKRGSAKRRKRPWDAWDEDQRLWHGRFIASQLRHDHQVFEAVVQDAAPALSEGGRIRRVRLDSEVRGLLASADAAGRRRNGAAGAREARCAEGRRLGLTVFEEGAPVPDALVEIERPDGSVMVRAVEVATGAYTSAQVAEKLRAGFQVYRVPNSRATGRRRRAVYVDHDMQLISWGR